MEKTRLTTERHVVTQEDVVTDARARLVVRIQEAVGVVAGNDSWFDRKKRNGQSKRSLQSCIGSPSPSIDSENSDVCTVTSNSCEAAPDLKLHCCMEQICPSELRLVNHISLGETGNCASARCARSRPCPQLPGHTRDL